MIEKLDIKNGGVEDLLNCIKKINELVDAVNKHEDIIRQIGEWGSSKGECLWCETLTGVNLDDRMIGCTTLDIPKSYKNDPYAEQDEIWKDIKGYENQYQISNLGNIRALSRKGQRKGIERMKTRISNWGYPIISIWKNNKQKTFAVHRLVAETFIANPNNKAEVNHKNGIKTDNRVENLEWVTREENIQHAYNTGLNPRSLPMPEVVKMPKIICCETGDVFNSITEASHKYNVSISHLSSCLNGKDNRKTVGGWHWLYCYCEPVKPYDDIIYKGGDNE